MKNNPIKVAVVLECELWIEALSLLLKEHGIDVVGACTNPGVAPDLLFRLSPDVIVLDVRFGEKTLGLGIAKEVLSQNSKAAIICVTKHESVDVIRAAYRAGALGCLNEEVRSAEFLQAIHVVRGGERYFMKAIHEKLRDAAIEMPNADLNPRGVLTERQLDVFRLQATGRTVSEIATALQVAERTVSNDAAAIKMKLSVQRPADITLLAIRWGIISPNSGGLS
jgi:two-component system, NarL family, invasion response regulator UvrY